MDKLEVALALTMKAADQVSLSNIGENHPVAVANKLTDVFNVVYSKLAVGQSPPQNIRIPSAPKRD